MKTVRLILVKGFTTSILSFVGFLLGRVYRCLGVPGIYIYIYTYVLKVRLSHFVSTTWRLPFYLGNSYIRHLLQARLRHFVGTTSGFPFHLGNS